MTTFDEVVQALGTGADSIAKIRSLTGAPADVALDEAVRLTLAEKDATIVDLRAQVDGMKPPPAPLPGAEYPNFEQIYSESFDTECGEGDFAKTYERKIAPYPYGWKDTSKKGNYNPGIISVRNGVMNMRLHTANGVPQVAAPQPKINGTADLSQLYGRYEVRFRSDEVNGYKTAWLLWPKSEVWPRDGEIDFPEGNLNANIKGFMHRQNDTSGGDQDELRPATPARYGDWHVAVIEWTPEYLVFLLDGTPTRIYASGKLTDRDRVTTRIPNTPMRWVLQTETELNQTYPAAAAVANVQVDYVKVWRYGRAA